MKSTRIMMCILLCLWLPLCGYAQEHRRDAEPKAPPISTHITARPNPVNPGSTILLELHVEKAPANLQGGTVVAADSRGNAYRGQLSRAEGISDTFITSIRLSPLVEPGELLFEVFILDSAGDLNRTHFLLLTIS